MIPISLKRYAINETDDDYLRSHPFTKSRGNTHWISIYSEEIVPWVRLQMFRNENGYPIIAIQVTNLSMSPNIQQKMAWTYDHINLR